ncbi:MAG: hypothetical protein ACYTCV_12505 [Planctomycetota bacterium]
MKRKMSKKIILWSVLVLISTCIPLLTLGCSVDNSASAARMVPDNLAVTWDGEKPKPYTVSVSESTGGKNPNPRWTSQISNTEFTAALMETVKQSHVFQEVTTGDGADYILDVDILNYDQPWYGSVMKVRMETTWKLTDAKTKKVVWSNTFPSAYRAEWKSSMFDRARIRNAHEGVARENIREGIRRLSALEL